MIEFIPSVNAARVGKVCINRKHNTKKPMNAERHIDLIEARKKLLNFDGSIQ
jgi:uracil phosphoribosyltransferase